MVKRKKEIVFCRFTDNLVGIYVDGKLVAQNHSLSEEEVLEAINVDYNTIDIFNDYSESNIVESLEWTMPVDLSELEKAVNDYKKQN